MYRFKLLAGGHEQVDVGSRTADNPNGTVRQYRTGDVVTSETDLAKQFGAMKFQFIGDTDSSRLSASSGPPMDPETERRQLRARLAELEHLAEERREFVGVTKGQEREVGYGDFDSMTIAELREIAVAEEIDLHGLRTKDEIIARLRE